MDAALLWAGLGLAIAVALFVDVKVFARGREPGFRESAVWSAGWALLGLAVGGLLWAAQGSEQALNYTTVYLIERSLSLDNLFVFLMLFGYFAVPQQHRGKLLLWGIVLALAMRGVAILAGAALIEQFHWVLYLLGATLIALAVKMFRGSESHGDPGDTVAVKAMRRLFTVADDQSGRFVIFQNGKRCVTPLALALAAIVFADIVFAVDSIPAAFAITTDSSVIWAANAFALMGLRSLFALVEVLVERFRYLDKTIAVVLGFVGVKILLEIWHVKVSPFVSLAVIAALFTAGIAASLAADRREQ